MSRFEPLFPARDCDDCGRRFSDFRRGCMPVCRPEPCCPEHHGTCCDDASIRVKLFDRCRCDCWDRRQLAPAAPPVTIVNPWNCHERVCVTLSVDECGNLVVCVKR